MIQKIQPIYHDCIETSIENKMSNQNQVKLFLLDLMENCKIDDQRNEAPYVSGEDNSSAKDDDYLKRKQSILMKRRAFTATLWIN